MRRSRCSTCATSAAADLGAELDRRLAAAPSNVADYADGGEVYRRLVTPLTTDLRRVVAHYAITGLFTEHPDQAAIYAYRVRAAGRDASDRAAAPCCASLTSASSRTITGRGLARRSYALLHVGGHDVSCALRAWEGRAAYDRMKNDLLARYAPLLAGRHGRADRRALPGRDVRPCPTSSSDDRRVALARVIASVLARHEETYRRIWEEHRELVGYLRRPTCRSRMPWPSSPVTCSSKRSAPRWPSSNERQDRCPPASGELLGEAPALGLTSDLAPVLPTLERTLDRALAAVAEEPAAARVEAARRLSCWPRSGSGLRAACGRRRTATSRSGAPDPAARPALEPLGEALGFALDGEVDG